MAKLHPNQISYLNELLTKDPDIQAKFNLKNSWDNLRDWLTTETYKRALALIFNNKQEELYELLPRIGINVKL